MPRDDLVAAYAQVSVLKARVFLKEEIVTNLICYAKTLTYPGFRVAAESMKWVCYQGGLQRSACC